MTVSEMFTAVGQVSSAVDTDEGATVVLTGDYIGWVAVEISVDGSGARWAPAGTIEQAVAMLVAVAGMSKIRLKCARLTSGSIGYDMIARTGI
jgi:hypothetical protein